MEARNSRHYVHTNVLPIDEVKYSCGLVITTGRSVRVQRPGHQLFRGVGYIGIRNDAAYPIDYNLKSGLKLAAWGARGQMAAGSKRRIMIAIRKNVVVLQQEQLSLCLYARSSQEQSTKEESKKLK